MPHKLSTKKITTQEKLTLGVGEKGGGRGMAKKEALGKALFKQGISPNLKPDFLYTLTVHNVHC